MRAKLTYLFRALDLAECVLVRDRLASQFARLGERRAAADFRRGSLRLRPRARFLLAEHLRRAPNDAELRFLYDWATRQLASSWNE